ncbi:hypothetical protein ACIGKL_10210 [Pseudomonas sp. NPDC077186]
MIWCVIGMALFRRMSAWDVVSRIRSAPLGSAQRRGPGP